MCKDLDQNTCYECEAKLKGKDGRYKIYSGLAVMCKCGETEYFVSTQMPFHKIIIPIDKTMIKRIKRICSGKVAESPTSRL